MNIDSSLTQVPSEATEMV